MLDNRLGARYDDAELAKHTEKLMGKDVPLPKLSDDREKYKQWKSEVTLRFPTFMLDAITYGTERYDAELGYTNHRYHKWYDRRRVLAFTSMALSLDMNLRDMFKVDDIRDQMEAPSLLWGLITAHFTKGDGVNPDYILREVVNHELKPGMTVDVYVKKSEQLVRRLREANGELEEWEHASLLLSNCQQVFRELAEQHTVWCSRNDRRTLTRAEVTRRLRQAEQARNQVSGLQSSQPALRAMQTVNGVAFSKKASGKTRKKRHALSKKDLALKKARTTCANCDQSGHWYAECTALTGKPLKAELQEKLKSRPQKPATSFVGAVGVVQPERATDRIVEQVVSPTYSPTSPASDDDQSKEPQRLNSRFSELTGNAPEEQ